MSVQKAYDEAKLLNADSMIVFSKFIDNLFWAILVCIWDKMTWPQKDMLGVYPCMGVVVSKGITVEVMQGLQEWELPFSECGAFFICFWRDQESTKQVQSVMPSN